MLAVFEIPGGRKVWEKRSGNSRSSAWPILPTAARSPAAADRSTNSRRDRFRPAARRRNRRADRASRSPADPAACSASRFHPTAARSRWPAATSPTSAISSSPRPTIVRPTARARQLHLRGRFFSGRPARGHGGWDKTIRIWDRETGAQLQTLDRPSRLRPRPGVFGRRHPARLGKRRQERAAMGPCRRRRKRRVSRPHRLCPLRGLWARRRPGRLGKPGRNGQALAGGGARHPGDVSQQCRLGRHRGPRTRRPPRRLGP